MLKRVKANFKILFEQSAGVTGLRWPRFKTRAILLWYVIRSFRTQCFSFSDRPLEQSAGRSDNHRAKLPTDRPASNQTSKLVSPPDRQTDPHVIRVSLAEPPALYTGQPTDQAVRLIEINQSTSQTSDQVSTYMLGDAKPLCSHHPRLANPSTSVS